ncbi:MAG TPA: rhomboid family intramembrane serine protease [Mycobacteriales bacterium]
MVIAVVIGLLWLIELVNLTTGNQLDDLGIRPRSLAGLVGIVVAPLLHLSVLHLVNNTVLLVLLGWIGLVANARRFAAATVIVWAISGFGVWLFEASGSVVVGASGIVYGWLAYLVARGWVAHRLRQALLGAVLLVFLGFSMIWGLLPLVPAHISWLGHLFGALGGLLAATLLDSRRRDRPGSTPALPTTPTSPFPGQPPV